MMACTRCGGLMVTEGLVDERGFRVGFEAERCLNCGHLEDRVIFANRTNSSSPVQCRQARVIGTHRRITP
jgi:hypothetical protein